MAILLHDKVAPEWKIESLNRDTVFNRHGGDLKGIQNHLDYLQPGVKYHYGWNPVIDDMPETEHGCAFTNHYKIDPRIGGEKYRNLLIDAMHAKGMKMIQDAVYNRGPLSLYGAGCTHEKTLAASMAFFYKTSYKDQNRIWPLCKPSEKKKNAGWMVYPQMPDLNQNNPYVANYLIQHAIWTVEEFGIDGWRIDTYPYGITMENLWIVVTKALTDDFPQITMFGETQKGCQPVIYFTKTITAFL